MPSAHKPTDHSRTQVSTLAGIGLPHEQIARYIRIDAKTLRKHYEDELRDGEAKANAVVLQGLYKTATEGPWAQRVAAQIFWAKTRLGWKETSAHEHTGKDGGPIQTEDVTADADEFARRMARLAASDDEGGTGESEPGGEGGA